ncbi:MAG: fluoride efflux transporter CrcB [Candidatus Omnitrophota bacterium]
MLKFFNIAIGGAVGALFRYWISGITYRLFSGDFPWGTLAVNLIGSLVIGLIWGVSETVAVSQNMRVLIFIGILGSFTTFSTFSLENFHLLRDGEYWFVFGNIMASVVIGIVLVFTGFFISKSILEFLR